MMAGMQAMAARINRAGLSVTKWLGPATTMSDSTTATSAEKRASTGDICIWYHLQKAFSRREER